VIKFVRILQDFSKQQFALFKDLTLRMGCAANRGQNPTLLSIMRIVVLKARGSLEIG
jgi:hypothetical protein